VEKVLPRVKVQKTAPPPHPLQTTKTVEAPPPAVPEPPPPPSPKASVKPAPIDPTQEIASVRAAHEALRAGNGAAALQILEQQGKKPGVLDEERAAARVLALCAAGRAAEARAEAARFVATYPRSPQVARVSSACIENESDNPF
jgi:hypothetical protein